MQVGIGLPATIPGVSGALIVEWARRADVGPFSSLSLIDRLVYPNYEPLMVLAAAASTTRRIRLMTSVLVAPLRDTAVLAKQALSLDAISDGRFTLGVGIGNRGGDYLAAGVSFTDRGRRLERQVKELKRIWAGDAVSAEFGAIGPSAVRPGGPELLIGGHSPIPLRRAGRLGDGFLSSAGTPASVRADYDIVEAAWKAEGRLGRPRFVLGMYFALGPDAATRGGDSVRHYYAFRGAEAAERIVNSVPTSAEAIREKLRGYESVGLDEVLLWPCIPELDQVDRLADLVR